MPHTLLGSRDTTVTTADPAQRTPAKASGSFLEEVLPDQRPKG